MSLGIDLATYIDSNSTFAAGTDLFVNTIRDSTTNRREVFVIEVQGEPAIEKFSGTLPAIARPSADVLVRSTAAVGGAGEASSTGTRSVAQNLWGLLVGVTNATISSRFYQRITAASEPLLMGRDEQGRVLFGFRVDAMRAPSTS